MADNQDLQNTSFFPLIPEEWLNSDEFNAAVVRCYASAISGDASLSTYAMAAINSLGNIVPGPFTVLLGTLEKDEPVLSAHLKPTFRNGQLVVVVDQRAVAVPEGSYVFVISPLFIGKDQTDESLLSRRADYVRGLLTTILGHMAMLEQTFEHRYEFDNPKKVSFTSPIFENHIPPAQWAALSADTFAAVSTIVSGANGELKDRLELSLSFIGRAAGELDHVIRFSHVWIALEIASGGHAAAKNFLNGLEHGGFKHEAKRFIDIRNALFHHGKRPTFDQQDERFLSACVLAVNLRNFGMSDPGFAALVVEHLVKHPAG